MKHVCMYLCIYVCMGGYVVRWSVGVPGQEWKVRALLFGPVLLDLERHAHYEGLGVWSR